MKEYLLKFGCLVVLPLMLECAFYAAEISVTWQHWPGLAADRARLSNTRNETITTSKKNSENIFFHFIRYHINEKKQSEVR